MPRSVRFIALGCAAAALGAACTPSAASEGSDALESVEIVAPAHGDTLSGPVTFVVDTGSLDVTGATTPGDQGGGYWLVAGGCVDVGDPLPFFEETLASVPDGATEVEVELPAGVHDVCLQFADAEGVTYYGTDEITVRVTA